MELSPGLCFLDQVLSKRRPSHAYFFFGPGNSGKEEKAKEFSLGLLCRDLSGKAGGCQACVSCKKIQSGNHPDLRVIGPDGEKIKIEQIRALKTETQYGPLEANWKIFLLHHCELLTEQAAQCLLKILEEPPRQIIFILTAPSPWAMLPTIVSRCQWVPFQSPHVSTRSACIASEHGVPDETASILARLQIPDEKIDAWGVLVREIPESIFNEPESMIEVFEKVSFLEDYKENSKLITDLLLAFYRDVMVLKSGWEEGALFPKYRSASLNYAGKLSWGEIWRRTQIISEARNYLDKSGNFRLVLENLFYQLKDRAIT